jgi:hypothetical protein
MRALLVVAILGAPASAQVMPGTNDDVGGALVLVPSVVPIPLEGFAVRGAAPEDTVVLVDGFEIPRLQHFLGLRSVLPAQVLSDAALKTAPDVGIGRGSTAVMLESGGRLAQHQLELSTFELAARLHLAPGSSEITFGARTSLLDPATDTRYGDEQLHIAYALASRWHVTLSSIWSHDESDRDAIARRSWFARTTASVEYIGERWSGSLAVSSLIDRDERTAGAPQHWDTSRVTIDTRGELVRRARDVAGLTNVEWKLGEQTNVAHHDIDVAWPTPARDGSPQPQHPATDDTQTRFTGTFWTRDAAAWTSLSADLGPRIRATTGLRADLFSATTDRRTNVATQPRGELYVDAWPQTRFAIAAGAYRRPPEHGEELFTPNLDPERSTQVTTRVEHEHQALRVQGNAYYIDRTRLVIRDDRGVLRNTGTGTSLGLEVSAQLKMLGWFASGIASLSRSTRKDFQRGAVRPSQFDQPLRIDLLVTKRIRRWQVGGRVQLAAGLPTTSIQQSVYDADHDVYNPIFGRTYDERLPYRYEIDLRVDRTFTLARSTQLAAFVDLRLSPSTLGYRDSFDYKERVAITMPVVPYVGVRGML